MVANYREGEEHAIVCLQRKIEKSAKEGTKSQYLVHLRHLLCVQYKHSTNLEIIRSEIAKFLRRKSILH